MKLTQTYPRLPDNDFFDDQSVSQHQYHIPIDQLKKIIVSAIEVAGKKSSRAILNLSENATDEEVKATYFKEGRELYKYFLKYYGDPASTAHQCLNRKCEDVAREQFRNRTLQKERMNSAWRYQYIAKDAALASRRFESVSDIGLREADFCAVIKYRYQKSKLVIYVSVKNRSNTMGGQDWPKAISALEKEAQLDKNRVGDYLCVFGISIERGMRTIRKNQKSGQAYSSNTELWFSDFFWPFFSDYTYEEIAKLVLEVLIDNPVYIGINSEDIPEELLESFKECCIDDGLLDELGFFNDPYRLVELFCCKRKK